jgi:hypothetical protein
MPGNLRFDDQCLPIVTVVFDRSGCSDDDVENMITGFEKLLTQNISYSVLFDGGGLRAIPNAHQRRRITDWERKRAPLIRRLNVGTALVADSALVRGAITATRWLSTPIAPEAVFGDLGEAGAWCLAQLDTARVAVPPSTREFVARLIRGGSETLRAARDP